MEVAEASGVDPEQAMDVDESGIDAEDGSVDDLDFDDDELEDTIETELEANEQRLSKYHDRILQTFNDGTSRHAFRLRDTVAQAIESSISCGTYMIYFEHLDDAKRIELSGMRCAKHCAFLLAKQVVEFNSLCHTGSILKKRRNRCAKLNPDAAEHHHKRTYPDLRRQNKLLLSCCFDLRTGNALFCSGCVRKIFEITDRRYSNLHKEAIAYAKAIVEALPKDSLASKDLQHVMLPPDCEASAIAYFTSLKGDDLVLVRRGEKRTWPTLMHAFRNED